MNINDLLIRDVMIMDLQAADKKGTVGEMVQKLYNGGHISDIDTYKEGILKHEAQTSTGLGDGVTMLHAKNSAVKEPTILFAKSKKGIDYEALGRRPTYLFFMIATPEGANDTRFQALAALSRLLISPDFVDKLKEAGAPEAVQALSQAAEDQKEAEEKAEQEQAAPVPEGNRKHIIVVTARLAGIAYTYAVKDTLKKKAKEMSVDIKAETNGSERIKNRLTAEDIARADGVTVAADKKVEVNRFDGKKLVNRPVSDGIRRVEELVNLAINGEAPTFHSSGPTASNQRDSAGGSVGSRIYRDLMNGVSHMLPFTISGGITIAFSFVIDQLIRVPQDQLANLGNHNDVASWSNQIGSAVFGFMLPILTGFIASSIEDRPGLVAGFAVDVLTNAGGAGFLGALIGGLLAGYAVVPLRKVFKGLPKLLDGTRTILFYPVFGSIITGLLMLVTNVPIKAINDALNHSLLGLDDTNAALFGTLLVGTMAIDLGGSVNRAAYVFGTTTLVSTVVEGNSVVMTFTMADGMAPPLAIFVATRLFKSKFTKDRQDAGLVDIVMGPPPVTEGAIPFTAADPLRVIPNFVVGSALTGALVDVSSIRLLAPREGIFVVLLSNSPLLYLLLILVGVIVSGVAYGLLKEPVEMPA